VIVPASTVFNPIAVYAPNIIETFGIALRKNKAQVLLKYRSSHELTTIEEE
jgi:hypothetical protein